MKKVAVGLGIGMLILLIIFLIWPKNTVKDVQQPVSNYTQNILPTDIPAATITIVPTIKTVIKSKVGNNDSNTGTLRGQITCNYLIPASVNESGTAKLDFNWNNLTISANVCVSVNGDNPKLITTVPSLNGSSTIQIPWISRNGNYRFILTDNNCSTAVLSECRIVTD